MCKCCQLCFEDLYWQCIEEKFCYDESIANYDPSEDEYCRKNGHATQNGEAVREGDGPITEQPTRMQRNLSINSVKVHEDEYKREIQTGNVNLAPEIIQVFANSQIFHDHKPFKGKTASPPATFSIGLSNVDKSKFSQDSQRLMDHLDEDVPKRRQQATPPKIIETPAIDDESDSFGSSDEVILRPRQLQPANSTSDIRPPKLINKNLKNAILDAPYFNQRPASENDIFMITTPTKDDSMKLNMSSTSDVNRFSMTPEVPSISFTHLPHNYAETPTIDKYKKEAPSLLEIQTSEIRTSDTDYSMPRYYGKSDLILNRSFEAVGSSTSIGSSGSSSSQPKKHHEKSKRLKNFRAHLPPLTIHAKDKAEKEK